MEFRAKINITYEADDIEDAFVKLHGIIGTRMDEIARGEDLENFSDAPFTGEIDIHKTEDEREPWEL